MDHPKKQISSIIHQLTEGSPSEQKHALDAYFRPDASFIHPLCRVPSFPDVTIPFIGAINSRWVIWMIYRWYKILSPRIVLDVECEEYNQKSQLLYVSIHQVFSLFFVPFYKSDVHLTTVLSLTPTENESGDKKYYIRSQEDLYQTNEVVKFFWPGGDWVVWLWQIVATGFCIVGSLAFWPLTMMEDRYHNKIQAVKSTKNGVKGI